MNFIARGRSFASHALQSHSRMWVWRCSCRGRQLTMDVPQVEGGAKVLAFIFMPSVSVRTRTNMDIFKKGWFTEANSELWSGQAFSLEVKEILYHSKSTYQNILIFQWY